MSTGPDPQWNTLTVSLEGEAKQELFPILRDGLSIVFVMKHASSQSDLTHFLGLIAKLDPSDFKPFILISSPTPPWSTYPSLPHNPHLPLHWTSAVWENPANIYILRGKEAIHRLHTLPADLKPYLKRPVCTLGQLHAKIVAGETEELIKAYSEVRGREVLMGARGVEEVLLLLGRRLGVELRGAVEWFRTPRSLGKGEDIINPEDVTFKQFARRLRSFCEFSTAKPTSASSLNHDPEYQTSLWHSRINALESLVQSLRSELASKDNTIIRLQQELRRAQNGSEKGSSSLTNSPGTQEVSLMSSTVDSEGCTGQPSASMFLLIRPQAKKSPPRKGAKASPGKATQLQQSLRQSARVSLGYFSPQV